MDESLQLLPISIANRLPCPIIVNINNKMPSSSFCENTENPASSIDSKVIGLVILSLICEANSCYTI